MNAVAVRNRQRRWKINSRLLAKLAEQALAELEMTSEQLSIVLVNDATIAKLNAQYHNTEGPTDILSFDYGDSQGELIVSVDHAVSQAKRYRTSAGCELALYIIHGILHLHGYDDRTAAKRRRMRAAERRLLGRLSRRFRLRELIKP